MAIRLILLLGLLVLLSGCAPRELRWGHDAGLVYDRLRLTGADTLLPAEFKSLEETLNSGAALLKENDEEGAEVFYQLAWSKGLLLEQNVILEKERRAEAARLKAEAEQRELERQRALLEENRRLTEQKAIVEAAAAAEVLSRKKAEKPRPVRERPLAPFHTVKRGETLPQIAALADVYNDNLLWPLLYRANRDQISDPQHIWPGQVLRIPRNFSRDDISEARRYAQERPLH